MNYLITNLFNKMIKEKEGTGSFWRRKSKETIPTIDPNRFEEHAIILRKKVLAFVIIKWKSQHNYGIEIRTLSDYDFPDEVWDDLNEILKQNYDELIQIT